MLSSWQVAQIHGQQSQQFGASQAYSQQLSAMMPAPYQGTGLGATGSGNGFSGGGYNYGGGLNSYGPGNSFGNKMTSMVGGFGSAVGGGMGIAGAIGGGMMGGIGGAMMGWAGGGVVGAGISHVANSFMTGAHEQGAVERTLSQFQFTNGASRTGKGFNRNDSMQIGNMVRQMERVPEMLTSFGELNRVMDKMGQMGLMQGVRDAGEFMKKFKDTIGVLKDLSKVMGSTMEGALQAFGEARASGFYSKGDITKNVLSRQFTGSITGMNQGQVGALQNYGAEMGHGTGGSRASGAKHALRTAGQLGMANQLGYLSNDQIVEMTGKEGADGIQDLSAQMTQLGYRMGNSNVGQAMTLALGEKKDGRYTGKMDEALVAKVRSGELSLSELKRLARSKASTRGAKLSFAAHKQRLRSEMVGAVGSEGVGMQLQEILGERGWQNPDAVNLVMQRFGASEEQANLLQQLMPNMQEMGTQMRVQGGQQARQQARGAAMKERYSWDAIKARIGKKIAHHTTDWAKDLGASVRDSFQSFADDFVDELAGTYTANLTQNSSNLVRSAMMGSSKARSQLTGMINQSGGRAGAFKGAHLGRASGGGFSNLFRRGMDSLGGTQLAGDRLKDVMKFMQPGELNTSGTFDFNSGTASQQQGLGNIILEEGHFGSYTSMDSGAIGRAQRLGTLGLSKDLTGEARSKVGSATYEKAIEALQKAASTGDVLGEGDTLLSARRMTNAVRQAIGDEAYNKLKLRGNNSDSGVLSVLASDSKMKGYDAVKGLEGKLKALTQGFDLNDRAGISKRVSETRKTLAKSFKISENGASFAEIDKAMSGDSTMRNILLGAGGTAGLVDTASVSAETKTFGSKSVVGNVGEITKRAQLENTNSGKSGMALRRALAKDASEWTDEETAAASAVGMTKEYAMKNKEALGRIRNAIDRQGGDVKSAIRELAKGQNSQDLVEIGSQLKGYGERISNVVDKYREQISSLTGSGKTAAQKIGALGKALEEGGIGAVSMIASGDMSSKVGEITELIQKADPKDRDKLINMVRQGGLGEIDAAISEWDRVMKVDKKRGRRHKGQLKDYVKEGSFGTDDEGQRMWKELETGLSKDGKSGVSSKEEAEWLAKQLSTGKASELMAKAGSGQQSKYMSEQEVANSLKSLSENNLKAAQIISNLAAGKTGKDAMEGVGK